MCAGAGRRFRKVPEGSGVCWRFLKVPAEDPGAGPGHRFWKVLEGSGRFWRVPVCGDSGGFGRFRKVPGMGRFRIASLPMNKIIIQYIHVQI